MKNSYKLKLLSILNNNDGIWQINVDDNDGIFQMLQDNN